MQCDLFTGQCPCIDNVEGRQCDKCKENKYDRQRGCLDCPHCYKLVQKAAHNHSRILNQLENVLKTIANNPLTDSNENIPEFENELKIVQGEAKELLRAADKVTDNGDISGQISDMKSKLETINRDLMTIDSGISSIHLDDSIGKL